MIEVSVDVSALTGSFLAFPIALKNELRKELKNQIQTVTREARTMHRYGGSTKRERLGRQGRGYTLTGKLAMSTLNHVNDQATIAEAYLETGIASYGVFVHEGHGGPGKSVLKGHPYVWEPDRFLDAAMKRREPYIQPAIEKAVIEGLRKAGL